LAQLVEQSAHHPKFKGSNPDAAGTEKKTVVSVTRKLNKILPNLWEKWPKIQNISIKAEFESPKHCF
jgi:hypothetical protein